MGKQTIEELEAQVKQLAMQLELSVAAERAWETTMMRVCGEDGPLSVAGKFNQLVAENAALKLAMPEPRNVEFDNDSMDDVSLAEDVGFNDAIGQMKINMSKTPATDSILASLRAEGVEMLRQHPAIQLCSLTHVCDEVVAQLRSKSPEDTSDIEPFGFVRRSGDLVVIDVNGDPHIKDGMPVFVRSKSEVQS